MSPKGLCIPFFFLYSMTRIICDSTLPSSARCECVGWPEVGSNFSSASEKGVEILSGSMLCLTWWPPWELTHRQVILFTKL